MTPLKAKTLFVLTAVIIHTLFFTLFCPAPQAQETTTPKYEDTNVILISLQCLRPDHLGTYGYKRNTSTNIDQMALEAVLFENAISQANLTPVAQMSVFTSQYPRVNGMISFEVTRNMVSPVTLQSILKKYGYITAASLSAPEFFMRYDKDSRSVVNPGDVFSADFDFFDHTTRGLTGRSVRKIPTGSLEWIKQHKNEKFFLWIGSGLIHMPYAAAVPPPYHLMYDPPNYTPFWRRLPAKVWGDNANGDPSYDVFSRVYNNTFYWGFSPLYNLTQKDVDYVNARYDAGIFYTDQFIGNLLKLLDELDLSKKTLVILHSIHGDELGETGNFFHYDITDTVIKNALIFRFPEDKLNGRRIAEQVQAIDIMPTILDYLNIPSPHQAQGGSLLPLVRGITQKSPSKYAYIDRLPWWEYTLGAWYLEFQKNDQKAHIAPAEREKMDTYLDLLRNNFETLGYPPGDIGIRTRDWKLIIRKYPAIHNAVSWWSFITGNNHDIGAIELYDLNKDPLEQTNVADKYPDVVKTLQAKLLDWDESIESRKAQFNMDNKHLVIPYPGEIDPAETK